MNYSNLGGAVMSQSAYAKVGRPFPNYQGHRQQEQPASTGWTSPHVIHEKMRQVNMSAVSLNADIGANVRRELFKGSWASWFANWRAFFEKYQGTIASLGALTYTDELFQQTLSYEGQLVSWYDAYGREKDGDKPVPPASGLPPKPNVPIPPSKELPNAPPDIGLIVPWWAWVVGAGIVAGAGYMTYRYVKRAQAIRRILDEKVVPGVLQVYGGPAGHQLASGYGEFAAASRDPATMPVVMAPSMAPAATYTVMPPPYSRYPSGV
jgi:hypothetical protein